MHTGLRWSCHLALLRCLKKEESCRGAGKHFTALHADHTCIYILRELNASLTASAWLLPRWVRTDSCTRRSTPWRLRPSGSNAQELRQVLSYQAMFCGEWYRKPDTEYAISGVIAMLRGGCMQPYLRGLGCSTCERRRYSGHGIEDAEARNRPAVPYKFPLDGLLFMEESTG